MRLLTVASILVLSLSATAEPANAGVVFTATRATDTAGSPLADLSAAKVRGWVEGDLGKVEYLAGSSKRTPAGSLLLTTDGGGTMLYYDAGRKSCLPAGPSVRQHPRFPPGGMVTTIEGLSIEKTQDEVGPMVAQRPTRHHRFRISYDTIRAPMAGVTGPTHRFQTDVVEDLWVVGETFGRAMRVWLDAGRHRTGDAATDARIADTLAQLPGTVLKRVTAVTTREESGEERRLVTKDEITTLELTEVPASTFELPLACRAIQTPSPR